MAFSSLRGTVLALLPAALLFAQDWKTSTDLNSVDLTGLTAAQKTTVLKVLRADNCPCGCPMKLAQCRVEDPSCTFSKSLSALVVATVKKGGDESAARAALEASPLVHPRPVNINVDGEPVLGPKEARVTFVEFSDFQCPYCVEAMRKLSAIVKAYPSDVKLVFKQYPLEMHSQAALAAAASLAAHKQGKFWQLHDAMFADRTHLTRPNILAMAGKIGLDVKRFQEDWDSPAIKQVLARDQKQGDDAGVSGTPTIFIDGLKYNGSLELDAIRPVIEKEMKRK